MHELAVCEAVLDQVLGLGPTKNILRINLRIGPLAGVEPHLLRAAFPLVASGTRCASAVLNIEVTSVQVSCRLCAAISTTPPNRLLCGHCNTWRVNLISGDEMLLASVEFIDAGAASPREFANV